MIWKRYIIEAAVITVQTALLLALCATMGIPDSEQPAASTVTERVLDLDDVAVENHNPYPLRHECVGTLDPHRKGK